jgi:hypothetical protein
MKRLDQCVLALTPGDCKIPHDWIEPSANGGHARVRRSGEIPVASLDKELQIQLTRLVNAERCAPVSISKTGRPQANYNRPLGVGR